MNEMRYLIGSTENNCVFTVSTRPINATALTSGLIDSFVTGITPCTHKDLYKQTADRDFFYTHIWSLDVKHGAKLTLANPAAVSSSWLALRELVRARQSMFTIWESFTASALVKSQRHQWDQFNTVAQEQIAQCDAGNNQFTPMIEEYARCLNLPPDQALKELQLQTESDNFSRFRITAMAEKWKQKINAATTVEQVAQIRSPMSRDFWQNAAI